MVAQVCSHAGAASSSAPSSRWSTSRRDRGPSCRPRTLIRLRHPSTRPPSSLPLCCCDRHRPLRRRIRSREFYRGKTVRITVGSASAAATTAMRRLVARHLGRHIPGNPTVVVQNMPGAGSEQGRRLRRLQAPKDGTAIGAIQPGAVLQPLRSTSRCRTIRRSSSCSAAPPSDVYLCMVRADAPAKTFRTTVRARRIIGTPARARPSATCRSCSSTCSARNSPDRRLCRRRKMMIAIERNEVQGMCGMSWSSISMQHTDWLQERICSTIVQEDLTGHPELNSAGRAAGDSTSPRPRRTGRSWS